MKCPYCGGEGKINTKCRGCGSVLEPPKWQKSEPFEYRGYIVWSLRCMDMLEFCFYQGRHLAGKQMVSRSEIMLIPDYQEGIDIMPWVFDKWMNSVDTS